MLVKKKSPTHAKGKSYISRVMKKNVILAISLSVAALLAGCSKGLKPSNPDIYKNKTGIIGVFRQSAFYCENVMPQYMTLDRKSVV